MHVLVPIDGSPQSERALSFAIEMATRSDATLDVIHVSDRETEATEQIVGDARERLADAGLESGVRLLIEDISFRPDEDIGDAIVEQIESGEYDQIVMGHHSSGTVERAIVGSATERVLRSGRVPVTVIP